MERENVKRLMGMVEKSFDEATKGNLFDFDVVCDKQSDQDMVKRGIEGYMWSIKNNGVFKHYDVGKIGPGTWENEYPNMFMRHHAMYAYLFIGSKFVEDKNVRPLETIGYPYKFRVSYSVSGTEPDEYIFNEYVDSYSYELSEEEEKEYILDGFTGEDLKVHKLYHWSIDDPTEIVTVDLFIQPIKPVQYIKLEAVITSNGMTLSDLITL